MSDLEQLVQLETELRKLAQRLPPDDPDARYEGRDATETVWVTVDNAGRVHALDIDQAWRDRMPPSDLGSAVQAAVAYATATRLTQWVAAAEARTDGPVGPHPATTAGNELVEAIQQQAVPDRPDEYVLNDLLAMLEKLHAGIDAVREGFQAWSTQTHVASTPAGHVSVTVTSGGELASVEYDRRWLERTTTSGIVEETRQALDEAYRIAAAASFDKVIAESPLGELQRLAADPIALARRLSGR